MAYTDAASVKKLIAGTWSTSDLSDADIGNNIDRADSFIDAVLAGRYQEFNAYDSTPATPAIIRHLSELHAAARSMRAINLADVYTDDIQAMTEEAKAIVQSLLLSDHPIAPETTATETLSFGGDQAWELPSDEAYLAATSPLDSGYPPDILPDTVRILSTSTVSGESFTASDLANMRNGREFSVEWRDGDRGYGAWVFVRIDGALSASGLTALNVSYQWDYMRQTGQSRALSSELIVG